LREKTRKASREGSAVYIVKFLEYTSEEKKKARDPTAMKK